MLDLHRVTALISLCATLSGVAQTLYTPADTLAVSDIELEEVQVAVRRRLPMLDMRSEPGTFRIGAEAMAASPRMLGVADPVRIMQSLPAVASSDYISGGIYVQGSEAAHNLVSIDGLEVYNPMHLLGLFSVFNAPHFESFDIDMRPLAGASANYAGAGISANSSWAQPQSVGGEVSAGIIESHATVRLPLAKNKSALTLSGRATYINALYGDYIKIENAPLKYDFNDWNLTFLNNFEHNWQFKLSAYYGHDRMGVRDPNYASDIAMGWDNLVVGATVRQADKQQHTIGFSRFANDVEIKYTDVDKRMPSEVYSLSYAGKLRLGLFNLGSGAVYRHVTPQFTDKYTAGRMYSPKGVEARIGADLPLSFKELLDVNVGFQLAFYHARDFSRFYPLPAVKLRLHIAENHSVEAYYSRRAQFTHKIEESTIGMPTDFYIVADNINRPLTANDLAVSFQGSLFRGRLNYSIGGYYRMFDNLTDWVGNLFSMLGNSYEPLSDVVTGHGRAMGLTAMVQGRVGPVKGWVSYTLSKSEQKFPGDDKWHVYSHDRTHDLKLTLTWNILHNLVASASFVYATGNPYTAAKYGYMIGENLIFEFEERNSSRLPPMHRLDLGLDWQFYATRRVSHSLNVGVFNAYGHENVMFRSFTYSPESGIHPTQWSMSFVLPSLNYCLKF